MHKIEYLPSANEDIGKAVEYISCTLGNPDAADSLIDRLDEVVGRISRHPYSYGLYFTDRPLRDEIRKAPVNNYVLYYAVYQDKVEIRRFLHQRQDAEGKEI